MKTTMKRVMMVSQKQEVKPILLLTTKTKHGSSGSLTQGCFFCTFAPECLSLAFDWLLVGTFSGRDPVMVMF